MNEYETQTSKKIKLDKIIDSFVNFIFSKNPLKWLILIILLGLIIRFIVVSNVAPLADEMIHGTHAINFIEKGSISHMTQCPLWFYLSDIFYKLLGVTLFSLRSMSFFFGSLVIIMVYLLSKLLFDEKVALISSFLLAVSPFFTRYALSYMDESMIFFVLIAIFLFIKKFKEKQEISLLSAVFLGMAMLIKIIAVNFVIVFGLFILIWGYKRHKTDKRWIKKNYIKIVLFFLIILLFFSPVLVYNYLLYKDKGIVDLPFAMYFNINKQFYQGPGLAHEGGFSLTNIPDCLQTMTRSFLTLSPVTFILFLFGIFLSFRYKPSEKKFIWFLLSLFVVHFLVLITAIGLQTHYAPFVVLFSIFSAISLIYLNEWGKKHFKTKNILPILIILILIINLAILAPYLTSRSAISKIREYSVKNLDRNSIVLVDARIYRGIIAWTFHDFHYLESSLFPQISQLNQELPGQNIPTKVYFIECVPDDCGWGTITNGSLNDSSEQLVQIFSNQANLDKLIYGGGGSNEETGKPYFKVYSATMQFKPQITSAIDSTHEWFFYPVGYKMKDKIYDKYKINNFFDQLLHSLAYLVLILSVILALISPLLILYFLIKDI